jgi:hypothetical protein
VGEAPEAARDALLAEVAAAMGPFQSGREVAFPIGAHLARATR